MGMSRQAKEEAVTILADRLDRAKGGFVASFVGLNVASVDEIRSELRKADVEYKVVKNTLMKRALTGRAIEGLGPAFVGPTAIAFTYSDEVGKLGKAFKELVKKYEKLEVKAAFIEDEILAGDVVETMASLPTLDEARAQLLGVINAPAAKLLAQINAPASNLVGVIKAKEEKDKEVA
ncbi:MAG: 50S ribosomal protein L10 [Myxococcales bacterium]|nr:50S ribosomal protein L10 [Myxococcales bacterium]